MEQITANLIELYGLVAIFGLMFINGLASAFPSEIVYGVSGALVYAHRLSFVGVLTAGVAGNVIGTTVLYYIGRTIGYRWLLDGKNFLAHYSKLTRLFAHWLPGEDFFQYFIDVLKRKDGYILIGFLRCLTPVRCVVSLPAGMLKMPLGRFIAASTIGCMVWAIGWVGLGYFLGESWHTWGKTITLVLLAFLIMLIIIVKHKIKKDIERRGRLLTVS
ncbi:DedA family protein [Candidatus Falkowbacteria bacterium]|nr:DedA family protein [Candidatus Falkowbacteria bacterium]